MIDAKTLIEYVDKWIALLADAAVTDASRIRQPQSLWTYLRDGEFPDESQLAKSLAQYVPALLQVAIRGYWDLQARAAHRPRPQGSPPPDATTHDEPDVRRGTSP